MLSIWFFILMLIPFLILVFVSVEQRRSIMRISPDMLPRLPGVVFDKVKWMYLRFYELQAVEYALFYLYLITIHLRIGSALTIFISLFLLFALLMLFLMMHARRILKRHGLDSFSFPQIAK